MTKAYFKEMMEEMGARCLDGTAFGVAGRPKPAVARQTAAQQLSEDDGFGSSRNVAGYPYSLELDTGARTPELTLRLVVSQSARPAWLALKEKNSRQVRWFHEPDEMSGGGVLGAVLRLPDEFYAKAAVHGALADAAQALRAAGLALPEKCPLCQNGGCDVYAQLGDAFRPAHTACLQTRLALPEEDHVTPVRIRGNYFTGILGGLLGALVGALPSFALAMGQMRISAPLYAFIPILSALLYRLLRGKARRNFSAVVVLLASIGTALLLELIWYWLVQAVGTQFSVTFWQTSALYFENHTLALSLSEMWVCLVALAIGFIPAGVLLRGYAHSRTEGGETIRGAAYVRASAMPIRPPEETQEPPAPGKAPVEATYLGAGI